MQHAILYGEHELTIDEKNRLLVPAEIRRSLDPQRDGRAFFVVIGLNHKPWLYPERYYEQLVAQRQQQLSPDEDSLAFDQYHFARIDKLELDKQGRILLGDKTLKRTGIGRDVTLIGVRDHFELWNRAEWETRLDELKKREAQAAQKQRPAQI